MERGQRVTVVVEGNEVEAHVDRVSTWEGTVKVTIPFYYSIVGEYHPKGRNAKTLWLPASEVIEYKH